VDTAALQELSVAMACMQVKHAAHRHCVEFP